MRDELPTDREMALIRNYRTGVFTLANASRGGVIGTVAFMDFHGLPDSWLEEYVDRFRAITAEQVQETAQAYLDIDGMTLVIVGDGATVRGFLVAEWVPHDTEAGGDAASQHRLAAPQLANEEQHAVGLVKQQFSCRTYGQAVSRRAAL